MADSRTVPAVGVTSDDKHNPLSAPYAQSVLEKLAALQTQVLQANAQMASCLDLLVSTQTMVLDGDYHEVNMPHLPSPSTIGLGKMVDMQALVLQQVSHLTSLSQQVLAVQRDISEQAKVGQILGTLRSAHPDQPAGSREACLCCKYHEVPCRQSTASRKDATKTPCLSHSPSQKRKAVSQEPLPENPPLSTGSLSKVLQFTPKGVFYRGPSNPQLKKKALESYLDGLTITYTELYSQRHRRSKKQANEESCRVMSSPEHQFEEPPSYLSPPHESLPCEDLRDQPQLLLATSTPDEEAEASQKISPVKDHFEGKGIDNLSEVCLKENVQGTLSEDPPQLHQVQSQRQIPVQKHKQPKSYASGRINHVEASAIRNTDAVLLGTLTVNSVPALVLFDPRATHSFITHQFATKHGIFKCPLRKKMLLDTPNGKVTSVYVCPSVRVQSGRVSFHDNLVVWKSSGIDVIIGSNWFRKYNGRIHPFAKALSFKIPTDEEVECEIPPHLTYDASLRPRP